MIESVQVSTTRYDSAIPWLGVAAVLACIPGLSLARETGRFDDGAAAFFVVAVGLGGLAAWLRSSSERTARFVRDRAGVSLVIDRGPTLQLPLQVRRTRVVQHLRTDTWWDHSLELRAADGRAVVLWARTRGELADWPEARNPPAATVDFRVDFDTLTRVLVRVEELNDSVR